MINSWKQFWSSEESTVILLCLLGMLLGLTIGNFVKDSAASFRSIKVIDYQIPDPISFGAVVGLDIQIISVVAIWIVLNRNSKLYVPVTWFLFGIPFGILTIFNVFSDRLVSVGFIIPYIFDLLLPCLIIIFVGMDAMCFLAVNALYLLPFCLISTGIVWLLKFSRSIV
jgi:hypothetical protein